MNTVNKSLVLSSSSCYNREPSPFHLFPSESKRSRAFSMAASDEQLKLVKVLDAQLSGYEVPAWTGNRELWHWSPFISFWASSVGGVHGVDVAVQLVSERQPGFGGEVDLGATTETSWSFAVAAPGCGGGEAGLHLINGNCCWGALPALAALFTAPVEGKTLQHLHSHSRGVWL